MFRSSGLLLCLLLSTVYLNDAQNSGSFRKPSTANDSRITEIQNKLITVQTDIIGLNAAILSGDSSTELKIRLNSLESQFQTLTEKLADERRQETESLGKYDTAIALLTSQHEALQKQLASVQKTIADKIQTEQEKGLPQGIQDAIKTQKFTVGEARLNEMADNDKIPDFFKALNKIEYRLAVLKALRYEMRANQHHDPYRLIEIVKALENSIVLDNKATANQKATGNAMINETMEELKNVSVEIFKHAMYSGTYAKNVEIEKLSDALNAFRSDILDTVMIQIVEGSFNVEVPSKILDNLYSHKNISQSISGIVALFYKMENAGKMNDEAMINMGDYLKQLQGRDAYKDISAAKKEAMTNVISKLPTCVKTVFFQPKVCFRSRGNYVNGGLSSNYEYNAYRHHVTLWFPGYDLTGDGWKVTKSGDKFYFEHVAHSKKYLYAGAVDYLSSRTRNFVYAIEVEGDIVNDKGAWNMELNGDYCYLKNVDNRQYMFAGFQGSRSKRRFAFTWIPGTDVRREDFQWQLIKCE